jgi:hypothetical protein
MSLPALARLERLDAMFVEHLDVVRNAGIEFALPGI